MQRLRGLILIGNTLLPVILLISIAGVFLYYKNAVADGWKTTEKALDVIINAAAQTSGEIKETADKTKDEMDRAITHFKGIKKKFDETYKDVNKPFDAIAALSVPTVTVSTKSITIPTKLGPITTPKVIPDVTTGTSDIGEKIVKPFKDAFGVINAAVQPFSNLVTGIDDNLAVLLRRVPEEARKAQAQTAIIAERARSVATPLGNMLKAIGYIAIALIFWFALSYVTWAHERLVRGWALLQGKPG